MERVEIAGLKVAKVLHDFIQQEALKGASVDPETFWSGLAGLIRTFAPRDRELLKIRDEIQAKVDEYHRTRTGRPLDMAEYERFLRDIGYILPEPEDFSV